VAKGKEIHRVWNWKEGCARDSTGKDFLPLKLAQRWTRGGRKIHPGKIAAAEGW
jgi:hypothetical protein